MRTDIPQLIFETREDFRSWLTINAETSEGVWIVFGKSRSVKTLKATEALEEALCFGWIDGQMQSLDDTKYIKYFAKRRPKSVWSVKNKNIVESLRERGMMTDLGERAIAVSEDNGMWDACTAESERAMVESFKEKLLTHPEEHSVFLALTPSTQLAEARWYYQYKTEAKREQAFNEIIKRLEKK
ncbi:MAG: hypothetical protein E7619_03835 [Ruminococcaceae bacterium]|nr:hypothetical protein [Oscillospiraceae bacterium]